MAMTGRERPKAAFQQHWKSAMRKAIQHLDLPVFLACPIAGQASG
jgi:hypothetical protein